MKLKHYDWEKISLDNGVRHLLGMKGSPNSYAGVIAGLVLKALDRMGLNSYYLDS